MAPPEPALPETRERRCPGCHSERIVHEGHVIGGGGLIKSEYRCELCRTAFWFVRKRVPGAPATPLWGEDGPRSN
jgi:hypothetical protein